MFKVKNIQTIIVPQYEELSSEIMYPRIKGYINGFPDYFPDYKDGYVPPRKFMWDIFSTLDDNLAQRFVNYAEKIRSVVNQTENNDTIEISEDIWNELNSKHFKSKKKGRALTMLASNKDYSNIQRKRKRKFSPLPIEEEKEEAPRTVKRRKMSDRRADVEREVPIHRRDFAKSYSEIDQEEINQQALDMNVDGSAT